MRLIINYLCFFIAFCVHGQSITGQLSEHKNETFKLYGYNDYQTYELATTKSDSLGFFTINYPIDYKGIGVLHAEKKESVILLLDDSPVIIKGKNLAFREGLRFPKNSINDHFMNLASTIQKNDRIKTIWKYIANVYKENEMMVPNSVKVTIDQEIKRMDTINHSLITNLPENSYLAWYSILRKLMNDMQIIISSGSPIEQNTLARFRALDFGHINFKTSGVLKELIELHYNLLGSNISNNGYSYEEMNISTKRLIKSLERRPELLNIVATELIRFFERQGLTTPKLFLSSLLLNNYRSVLQKKLIYSLTSYTSLDVGKIAPNIQLTSSLKMSDLHTKILLVFGSSECDFCVQDVKKLKLNYYKRWKEKVNFTLVYISIDTNRTSFSKVYRDTPWTTYCDFLGWENQAVQDYSIASTPTYILLDKNLKVLAHPTNLAEIHTWMIHKL